MIQKWKVERFSSVKVNSERVADAGQIYSGRILRPGKEGGRTKSRRHKQSPSETLQLLPRLKLTHTDQKMILHQHTHMP